MPQLFWNKSAENQWCSFLRVELNHSHFDNMDGVYIIWQGGGRIIRVGQGFIRDRIAAHRNDPQISQYNNLFVTWASVPSHQKNSIERFLANNLNPVVGETFPSVLPLVVNLPDWN